jgi:hypothetical protein
VKLHLICATNGVPLCYELTPANVADISLAEELIEAHRGGGLGGWSSEEALGRVGLSKRGVEGGLGRGGDPSDETEPSERRRGVRQRVEIAICSLKRVFGLGQTLASTLVGLATRIAAKIAAYTYAFAVNRMLGRPQGRIKELWAST